MPQTGSMPVRGLKAVSCWCASTSASYPADGRRPKFLHRGPLRHRFFGLCADFLAPAGRLVALEELLVLLHLAPLLRALRVEAFHLQLLLGRELREVADESARPSR